MIMFNMNDNEHLIPIKSFLSKDVNFRFTPRVSVFDRGLVYFLNKAFTFSTILSNSTFIKSLYGLNYQWQLFFKYISKYVPIQQHPVLFKQTFDKLEFFSASCLSLHNDKKMYSHATSFDNPAEALSRTYGEAIERFLSAYAPSDLEKFSASVNMMKKKYKFHIPQDFHGYDMSENGPSKNFIDQYNPNKDVVWVMGQDLITNAKVPMLKQQLFWMESMKIMNNEWFAPYCNTNGCAAGFTYKEAILAGFFELVERDAFLVHWLSKTPPTILEIDSTNEYIPMLKNLRKALSSFGYEIYIMDITTDIGYPTACCTVVRWGKNFDIHISAASGFSIVESIIKSLKEVTYAWDISLKSIDIKAKKDQNMPLKEYIPFFDKNIGQFNRIFFWAREDWQEELKSWWIQGHKINLRHQIHAYSDIETLSEGTTDQKLSHIKNNLVCKGSGYDHVYIYNYRNKNINKCGYHVVQVVAPKLYPLYLQEFLAYTKSQRIEDFKRYKNSSYRGVYPYPHCFV
jgi:thiazole/oxazole-forming peptide maturase SagD family component